MTLRPPALVAVDEFGEEGGLLGVARDELVLQELLGGGPLPGAHTGHQAPGRQVLPGEPLALRARRPGLSRVISIAAPAGSLVRGPQVAGAPRGVGGCTPSSPGEGPPSIPSWPGPGAQQRLPWHSGGASSPVTSKLPLQTDCMPLHASTHTHTHTQYPLGRGSRRPNYAQLCRCSHHS